MPFILAQDIHTPTILIVEISSRLALLWRGVLWGGVDVPADTSH